MYHDALGQFQHELNGLFRAINVHSGQAKALTITRPNFMNSED
jgi:hypothetical protein